MRSAIGLIVVGLLVSGCTGTSAPPTQTKPTAPAAQGPVEIDQSTRLRLSENAVYRTWDPCALHDPEAVKKVFGGEFEMLEPESLDTCVARVKRQDLATWSLALTAGASFYQDSKAQQTELAGRTYYSDSRDATGCTWNLPVSKQSSISLRLSYHGGTESKQPPKPACEFGKDYLTSLAPIWANPPLRADGATDPQIALAAKDPCATHEELAKLLPQSSDKPQLIISSVYSCVVKLPTRSKSGTSGFDVRFLFGQDPVPQLARTPGQYQPIQIEGRPGMLQQKKEDCHITVQADETAIVGLDEEVPLIRVTGPANPDCKTTETAAKLITKAALS